jgi:glutamate N-acetyltransferase/amino-acid N-acetyltransferase
VFTRNAFRAACISHTESSLRAGTLKAVVVNSGNSNAATGAKGVEHVKRTAQRAAALLKLDPAQVAVASTGIIGVPLPIDTLEAGLDKIFSEPLQSDGAAAAEAICTTDLCTKESFKTASIGGVEISVSGFAKGSGMIAPNMGTMLAFLASDARVPSPILQEMFKEAVDASFNMVSVDTDTSTSDMALLFATGEKDLCIDDDSSRRAFQLLLTEVCIELARMIARDGEGAEKLIEVRVEGAESQSDARQIALSIVSSPLVKTAIHGADPNWGRVIMALGKTPGVSIAPERVDLYFGNVQVLSKSAICADYSADQLSETMKSSEVLVRVCLNIGDAEASAWGCDLTKRYVDINVDYN